MSLNDFQDTRDQRSAEISWPFGPALANSIDYAAAIEINPLNAFEVDTFALLTGDVDLTSVPSEDLYVGAFLIAKFTADASIRTVTLGAGFEWDNTDYAGGAVAVAATKTVKMSFVYDGSAYVLTNVIKVD